ncbi:HYC_CC_PP family protein [Portibacter marinus]|uniref:HYC_CC_PP family protein n=1 Tax=Portibacter marinus TaxID=2898660 RepID=UPI001F26180B|nr:hypothetical protein [Portibacter marinus]
MTLAILMFSTSMGFSMDVHFCQGKLKSVAFFSEAKTCHETMVQCPRHGMMKVSVPSKDKDCCSNQSVEMDQLDADFNLSSSLQLTEDTEIFIAAFIQTFFTDLNSIKVPKTIPPNHYFALLDRDIYALNEAFLL